MKTTSSGSAVTDLAKRAVHSIEELFSTKKPIKKAAPKATKRSLSKKIVGAEKTVVKKIVGAKKAVAKKVSRAGTKVKKLSREVGMKVGAKKPAQKKATPKKPAAKKATPKKPAAKKAKAGQR